MKLTKKKMKKIIAFLTLILLIFSLFSFSYQPYAVSREETEAALEEAEKRLAEIQKKQKELEAELKEAKTSKKTQIKAKMLLEEQLNTLNDEIDAMNDVLDQLQNRIDQKNRELEDANGEYDRCMQLFRQRVRANYEAGQLSDLQVILTSESISDMITRIDLLKQVLEYDQNLFNRIKGDITNINNLKTDIEKEYSAQKETMAELKAAKKEQKAKINEIDNAIQDLNDAAEEIEDEQDRYDQLERELDEQIDKLVTNLNAYNGDELCWPVPGHSRISSPFGWRTLYGRSNYHTGIDIPAPKGTEIIAAAAGEVIYAQWTNTGGGNKIVIDHGSGLTTQYCHMSKFAVKNGAKVEKGQVIGYVGSTGNSTGNHLHFVIRYDGQYYNPSLYVNPSNSTPTKSIKTLIGG